MPAQRSGNVCVTSRSCMKISLTFRRRHLLQGEKWLKDPSRAMGLLFDWWRSCLPESIVNINKNFVSPLHWKSWSRARGSSVHCFLHSNKMSFYLPWAGKTFLKNFFCIVAKEEKMCSEKMRSHAARWCRKSQFGMECSTFSATKPLYASSIIPVNHRTKQLQKEMWSFPWRQLGAAKGRKVMIKCC